MLQRAIWKQQSKCRLEKILPCGNILTRLFLFYGTIFAVYQYMIDLTDREVFEYAMALARSGLRGGLIIQPARYVQIVFDLKRHTELECDGR